MIDPDKMMIGDYVRVVDDDSVSDTIRGKIAMVEGLYMGDGDITVSFPDTPNKNYWTEDMSDLEPIPLTTEILQRNFGKKTFYGIFDDYFDITIRELSDSLYVVDYHNTEMNLTDQRIIVCFVHELQHALRFFGIEKLFAL